MFNEAGENIILFKPHTYMNLSGQAIIEIANYYHIEHKDILVVYDDKDIPFAALRLREKGNAGSHNGMKSIIQHLSDTTFPRIRVGMGTPINGQDMVDFVLSKFTEDELKALDESFNNVAKACDLFIKNDFNKAMNNYNFRKNS
jgi:PTH1 family peptidyl-tRNA hydrolase